MIVAPSIVSGELTIEIARDAVMKIEGEHRQSSTQRKWRMRDACPTSSMLPL